MSHDVDFAAVRRRIDEFGRLATLVTVNEAARPHVVTALVAVGDDRLAVDVGPRTRTNLEGNPAVTLVWSPPTGGHYQLLLDAVAEQLGDIDDHGVSTITLDVSGGILHRVAGHRDGASCMAV